MTLFGLLQFAAIAAVLAYVVPKLTSSAVSTYGSFVNGCIATFWIWLVKLALFAASILIFGRLFDRVLYVRGFGGAFVAAIAIVATMMLLPMVLHV